MALQDFNTIDIVDSTFTLEFCVRLCGGHREAPFEVGSLRDALARQIVFQTYFVFLGILLHSSKRKSGYESKSRCCKSRDMD